MQVHRVRIVQDYCSLRREPLPEIAILAISTIEVHVVSDTPLDPFAADTTVGITELAFNMHPSLRRTLRHFPDQIVAVLLVVIRPDIQPITRVSPVRFQQANVVLQVVRQYSRVIVGKNNVVPPTNADGFVARPAGA
jgi:hypothetical protein